MAADAVIRMIIHTVCMIMQQSAGRVRATRGGQNGRVIAGSIADQGPAAPRHAAARRPQLRSHRHLHARAPRRGCPRRGAQPSEPGGARRPARARGSTCSRSALIFVGGPVEPDALIALARVREPLDDDEEHLAPLGDDLASVDLAADPAAVLADDQRACASSAATPGGARASSRARSTPAPGWCSIPTPTTSSPASPTSCGAPSCVASPAASPGSPTPPTTSPPTESRRRRGVRSTRRRSPRRTPAAARRRRGCARSPGWRSS